MINIEDFAKTGELFDNHYKLLRPLSTDGGTADVWLALDANTVKDRSRLDEAPNLPDDQIEELGSDPTEFLGFNPFPATLEIKLKADYANRDSLKWIAKEIRKDSRVSDLAYMEDLMNKVNTNLSRVSLILLVLAVLLTFVSFSLISNTVRLSIYANRFVIHTMKLVGASWGFIRRPFLRQAMLVGVIAAVFAIGILGAGVYGLYMTQPGIDEIVTWQVMAITAGTVFLFGLIITALCAWLAVNKFLRMRARELYKI
jgi:cell division transport system permease protein